MNPSEYRQLSSGGSIGDGAAEKTSRDCVDGAKCLNRPDTKKGKWQAEKLFDANTAQLMNQWGEEERLQKRLSHQTSLADCAPMARCTPSPISQTFGFYLNDVGHTIVSANSVSSPTLENQPQEDALLRGRGRILQEFQVVYVYRGKGIFQSKQDGVIPLNAGDALLLFPGEWHRYQPDPEVGWAHYWIRFNGEYANKLMDELFLPSHRPIIRIGYNEVLIQLLSNLTETMHINPLIAAAQGIEVLTYLATPLSRSRNKYSERIEAARCYMSEYAEENIDYETLARKVGMSYSVFRREFREIAKMPIRQYHIMIRMNKAKELLSETTLPIGEIAYQLGYDDAYLFYRLFKSRIGMAPSEYRQTASSLMTMIP